MLYYGEGARIRSVGDGATTPIEPAKENKNPAPTDGASVSPSIIGCNLISFAYLIHHNVGFFSIATIKNKAHVTKTLNWDSTYRTGLMGLTLASSNSIGTNILSGHSRELTSSTWKLNGLCKLR